MVKKLLYTYKYKPYLSDLTEFLTDLLHEALIQNETYMRIGGRGHALFIPIPLSSKKFRERGYNQALLLSRALAKRENGKVCELLERKKDTKPQFGLSREERSENIKGAFETRKSKIAAIQNGKKIAFLVDDVVTTGSTLVEAANVLKRNGFTSVWGITFAQD